MSELISGKEAFNAALDGKGVLWRHINNDLWLEWSKNTAWCIEALECNSYQFKLKPKTITINGIEVPAPFEPKIDDGFWHISTENDGGYAWQHFENRGVDYQYIQFGTWRTEDEIKQVVSALRSIFKG